LSHAEISLNIIVVNVTCFRNLIITAIIFAWFPAFNVYGTPWFVCDVADRFGFCGCRFSVENRVKITATRHITRKWLV
jgi:hypothetical protein